MKPPFLYYQLPNNLGLRIQSNIEANEKLTPALFFNLSEEPEGEGEVSVLNEALWGEKPPNLTWKFFNLWFGPLVAWGKLPKAYATNGFIAI